MIFKAISPCPPLLKRGGNDPVEGTFEKSGKGENTLLSGVWGCPPKIKVPQRMGDYRGFGYCFPLFKGGFQRVDLYTVQRHISLTMRVPPEIIHAEDMP